MKRLCYVGFLATVLLGTGLHFLYAWRPIPLFGLFAPVNESVWEHLKLLYWPFLVVCGVLSHWAPSPVSFWGAACGSLLAMPPVLLGSWYTARYGFGVESTAFDIGLYGLVVALGFLFTMRRKSRGSLRRYTASQVRRRLLPMLKLPGKNIGMQGITVMLLLLEITMKL